MGIASLLLTFALYVAPHGRAPVPSSSVPFVLGPRGAIVVPVLLDGEGPYRFVLDTGATGTAVVEEVARRFRLPAIARMRVVTVTGAQERSLVRLGNASLGTASVEGILATVITAPDAGAIGRDLAGVLGQDFLSHHDYTLDYRKRRLVWGAAEPRSGGNAIHLALRPSAGRFLVELPQDRRGGNVVKLVPDSGCNTLVVFERMGRTALRTAPLGRRVSAMDLTGQARFALAVVRELRIGTLRLRNIAAALVGRSGTDANEADGLLPLHLFASASFESRHRRLTLRPH